MRLAIVNYYIGYGKAPPSKIGVVQAEMNQISTISNGVESDDAEEPPAPQTGFCAGRLPLTASFEWGLNWKKYLIT